MCRDLTLWLWERLSSLCEAVVIVSDVETEVHRGGSWEGRMDVEQEQTRTTSRARVHEDRLKPGSLIASDPGDESVLQKPGSVTQSYPHPWPVSQSYTHAWPGGGAQGW